MVDFDKSNGKNGGIVIDQEVRDWLKKNYDFIESPQKPGVYSTSYRDRSGALKKCLVKFDHKNPNGVCMVENGDELIFMKDLANEDKPEALMSFALFMAQRVAEQMSGKQQGQQENNTSSTPPGQASSASSAPPAPGATGRYNDNVNGGGAPESAKKPEAPSATGKPAQKPSGVPASTPKPSGNKFLSIAQKIKSVAEVDTNLSVLVYGRSGTGKTTFASTFPKPMLIVDVREKGTIGLRKIKGIDVVEIESWKDVQDLIEYLKAGHEYQTIVIDTVTGLQDLATDELLRKNNMKTEDKITLPMHGVIGQMMIGILMDLREIAPYVVYLAQDKENKKDADAGATDQIEPSAGAELKDKVAKTLNRAVSVIVQTLIRDEIGHDKQGKVVMRPAYRLRVGPNATYMTKIRQEQGIEVPSDIQPSYAALMEIMNSKPAEAE